ncbi:unnamed protein product, partial [Cylicocyclus nassatus]
TLSVRPHSAEESSTVTEKEQTTSRQKRSQIVSSSGTLILAVMLVALIITGCIVCASLWLLSRRRKAIVPPPEIEGPPTPQKINSEIINLEEFQDTGPLVMQARLKGRLRHALDNEKSHSLKEVQFDPKQNEICLIGSDVEQLVGMSQLSLMSGEKSAEAAKASKKKAPVTMASEIKKAQAAVKEAQRVAENERMIAICAKRRRAKEEAQRAAQAKAALEAQKKARSDESRSSGQISDSSKTVVKKGTTKPAPSPQMRSIKEQLTQTSTVGHRREMEHIRPQPAITSHYARRSEISPSQFARPTTSYTTQRTTYPSKSYYDETDGIGFKYQGKKMDVSTSSTSISTASAPRRQPESDEELNFLDAL